MTAIIGATNLVESGTVTTSGDDSSYPKENAQSWKTSSWWKADAAGTEYYYIDMGAAVDVDCWGVAGHNLVDVSGSIQVEYSSTGAWAGEEASFDSAVTPTENIVIFRTATSQNKRYWRFKFVTTGDAALIGNLFLGEYISLEHGMPAGFAPAHLNRDRDIFNNKSEGGHWLGRSLHSKGAKIDINQPYVTKTWIDANWLTLADHIELYPFYFMWDDNSQTEVAYCFANNIDYPTYVEDNFLSFGIKCGALYDI